MNSGEQVPLTPGPSPQDGRGEKKQPPKLLDQVAAKMRLLHYSKRTEGAYVDWIKRFILHHHKRHPREMGVAEIEAFPTQERGRGMKSMERR